MTPQNWFVALVAACASPSVQSAPFLEGSQSIYPVHANVAGERILDEVENHFGEQNVKRHVAQMEGLLRDLYHSLSKNGEGRLGATGVRYALHRLFAQKHGWLVEGLDANGGSWNESLPTAFLKGRVPEFLVAMFEDQLVEHGFELHEVALLAAMLENLVRAETTARIHASYAAVSLSTDGDLSAQQVDQVLEASFMVYLFETDLKQATEWVKKVRPHMDEVYPGWQDTLAFLRDEQGNLAYLEKYVDNPFVEKRFNFETVLHVAEGIHDKYGQFQDLECYKMKDELLVHEYKNSGRILLSDFYGLALAGDWRYSESVDYLRQLGALDESDSNSPAVIVPNYVYGKSMCLAASSYYSVCCLDECERLLAHLERDFAKPAVDVPHLADAVARLPSSTVAAPRNLSTGLIQRLHEIAVVHNGVVPLHGRLFAQFMHHAYPRECPFPHVSGTINPLTATKWTEFTNQSSTATEDVVKELGRLPGKPDTPAEVTQDVVDDLDEASDDAAWNEELPWMSNEELVVMFDPVKSTGSASIRILCMATALLAIALILGQTVRTGRGSVCHDVKVFV